MSCRPGLHQHHFLRELAAGSASIAVYSAWILNGQELTVWGKARHCHKLLPWQGGKVKGSLDRNAHQDHR